MINTNNNSNNTTSRRRPAYGSSKGSYNNNNNNNDNNYRYSQTISRSSNLNPSSINQYHYITPAIMQQQQHYRLSSGNKYSYSNKQNNTNGYNQHSTLDYQSYQQPLLAGSMTLGAQERNQLLLQRNYLQQQEVSLMGLLERQAMFNRPLCRCRVMYLGSSVPHITKNGLHGIQEPLRHLYPEEQFNSSKFQHTQAPALNNGAINQSRISPSTTTTSGTGTTIDISHLSSSLGIDSWLSVWSNGLLLENVDEFGREIKRFFSIESLHYCAAVRYFDTSTLATVSGAASGVGPTTFNGQDGQILQQRTGPNDDEQNQTSNQDQNNNNLSNITTNSKDITQAASAAEVDHSQTTGGQLLLEPQQQQQQQQQQQRKGVVRFLPLDAPLFQCPGMVDTKHPPVFASIMRRTTGIKVLECHAFICRRDAASNALVRCCTQAYADLLSAKRLSVELSMNNTTTNHHQAGYPMAYNEQQQHQQHRRASGSSIGQTAGTIVRNTIVNNNNNNNNDEYQSIEQVGGINNRNRSRHDLSLSDSASSCSSVSGGGGGPDLVSNRRKAGKKKKKRNSSFASIENNDNYDQLNVINRDLNSASSGVEDNYAIITKSNRDQTNDGGLLVSSSTKLNNNNNNLNEIKQGRQQKRRDRREKGSSKSLYDDFMPQYYCTEECCIDQTTKKQHQNERKLSHSLDLLKIDNNNYRFSNNIVSCCQDNENKNDNNNNTCDDLICYSIVKRHSKSMQNLGDGPYEFTCPSMKGHERRRTVGTTFGKNSNNEPLNLSISRATGGERISKHYHNRKNHSSRRDSLKNSSHTSKNTKSHSYQDMRFSSNRYSDRSFQEDKQRFLSSCENDNKQAAAQYSTINRDINGNKKQGTPSCCELAEVKKVRKSSHSKQKTLSTSSSKQSSKRGNKSQADNNKQPSVNMMTQQNFNYPQQQQQYQSNNNNINNQYQQPAHYFYQNGHPHPAGAIPSSYYHQPAYMQAPQLTTLSSPPPAQPPPLPTQAGPYQSHPHPHPHHHIPLPLSHHHQSGPSMAYGPLSPTAAAAYDPSLIYQHQQQHNNNQASSHYMIAPPTHHLVHYGGFMAPHSSSLYPPGAPLHLINAQAPTMLQQQHNIFNNKNGFANTISAGRSKSRENNNKTSLATRFRCLSPPLNFLSASSQNQSTKEQTSKKITKKHSKEADTMSNEHLVENKTINGSQAQAQAQLKQQEPFGEDQQRVNSVGSSRCSSAISLDGAKIISGQPAFTCAPVASSTAVLKQQQQQQTNKKMSWIKRLSLTMGSVNLSQHEVSISSPRAHQSSNSNGQQQQQQQTCKTNVGVEENCKVSPQPRAHEHQAPSATTTIEKTITNGSLENENNPTNTTTSLEETKKNSSGQTKKRRSSLFSGTLSLSRTKQQPKLITT